MFTLSLFALNVSETVNDSDDRMKKLHTSGFKDNAAQRMEIDGIAARQGGLQTILTKIVYASSLLTLRTILTNIYKPKSYFRVIYRKRWRTCITINKLRG